MYAFSHQIFMILILICRSFFLLLTEIHRVSVARYDCKFEMTTSMGIQLNYFNLSLISWINSSFYKSKKISFDKILNLNIQCIEKDLFIMHKYFSKL